MTRESSLSSHAFGDSTLLRHNEYFRSSQSLCSCNNAANAAAAPTALAAADHNLEFITNVDLLPVPPPPILSLSRKQHLHAHARNPPSAKSSDATNANTTAAQSTNHTASNNTCQMFSGAASAANATSITPRHSAALLHSHSHPHPQPAPSTTTTSTSTKSAAATFLVKKSTTSCHSSALNCTTNCVFEAKIRRPSCVECSSDGSTCNGNGVVVTDNNSCDMPNGCLSKSCATGTKATMKAAATAATAATAAHKSLERSANRLLQQTTTKFDLIACGLDDGDGEHTATTTTTTTTASASASTVTNGGAADAADLMDTDLESMYMYHNGSVLLRHSADVEQSALHADCQRRTSLCYNAAYAQSNCTNASAAGFGSRANTQSLLRGSANATIHTLPNCTGSKYELHHHSHQSHHRHATSTQQHIVRGLRSLDNSQHRQQQQQQHHACTSSSAAKRPTTNTPQPLLPSAAEQHCYLYQNSNFNGKSHSLNSLLRCDNDADQPQMPCSNSLLAIDCPLDGHMNHDAARSGHFIHSSALARMHQHEYHQHDTQADGGGGTPPPPPPPKHHHNSRPHPHPQHQQHHISCTAGDAAALTPYDVQFNDDHHLNSYASLHRHTHRPTTAHHHHTTPHRFFQPHRALHSHPGCNGIGGGGGVDATGLMHDLKRAHDIDSFYGSKMLLDLNGICGSVGSLGGGGGGGGHGGKLMGSSSAAVSDGQHQHVHMFGGSEHQRQQKQRQQQQQQQQKSANGSIPWRHRQCPSVGSSNSSVTIARWNPTKHWLAVTSILLIVGAVGVAVPLALRVADGASFEERLRVANQLLDVVPLVDGHNDMPWNIRKFLHNQINDFNFDVNLTTVLPWSRSNWSHTDLYRLKKGKVSTQFWAAYVPCDAQHKDAVQLTLEQIDVIIRLTDKYRPKLTMCNSAFDIAEAHKNQQLCSFAGVEGGHSIGGSLSVLRMFYALGVRYMTLTSTCHTTWADSSSADGPKSDQRHGGLTEHGRTIVREMNRIGMIVDLSHVSRGTMRDTLNTSEAPVIFSHSSAAALCNSSRNVPDDVLRMVTKNGGLVMINLYSLFLTCSEESTIHDAVAHINHIRQVAGVDHVGIGAGFDGINHTPTGLEDVSTYPVLFAELLGGGWTADDLAKLAGQNFVRVLAEVEALRDKKRTDGQRPYEDVLSVKTEDPFNCTSGLGVAAVAAAGAPLSGPAAAAAAAAR